MALEAPNAHSCYAPAAAPMRPISTPHPSSKCCRDDRGLTTPGKPGDSPFPGTFVLPGTDIRRSKKPPTCPASQPLHSPDRLQKCDGHTANFHSAFHFSAPSVQSGPAFGRAIAAGAGPPQPQPRQSGGATMPRSVHPGRAVLASSFGILAPPVSPATSTPAR